MPIANIQDAREVEQSLHTILTESDTQARIRAIRSLFTETLDYYHADSKVSLHNAGNHQLPAEGHLIARRDGVSVVYVSLDSADTNRVTGAVASVAAKALRNVIADNLLLLFTSRDNDQLHFINPDLSGSRPKLQRIVAYRDQPQRTTVQQIANMWNSYDKLGKTVREAIAIAFSVEPVTTDFFKAYDALFKNAKDRIDGFGNTETEQDQKHIFTQTLFNRLMFVYFLSRKGWLRFQDSADYLNALWQDYNPETASADFYTTRLRPLFFSGLNNPDSKDLTVGLSSLIGKVPFLNGGLFDETDLDKRDDIAVPDAIIHQILTDLFDRFNFTVMESTPYDVEVAVDPEMLGKVFEELVTGRHDSGAYYTPRPVVSFMCREALKGYLEGKETGASPEAIAAFVDRHDTDGIGVAEARRISLALSEVMVVDPACGSGAYLLGMMQELIELQRTLFNAGVDAKKDYDLKLEIIQRNLYGVDIDDFAVNIAMLRLWLSLAIDFEGDDPQPLPNLDFKVLRGDSLLGPDPSAGVVVQGNLGQDTEQFRHLGQLKAEYMRASLGSDKDRLRTAIGETQAAIRESLGAGGAVEGVIDWRVEFAEVFAERRGFDVAIANPPYVRYQKIGQNLSRLRAIYKEGIAGNSDLYCYFYVRAIQLLNQSGIHVFVCSNSWLEVAYGQFLQDYLFKNSHVKTIYQSSVERQFSTALVNTLVSVIAKSPYHNDQATKFVSLEEEFETATTNSEMRREIELNRLQLDRLSPGKRFQGFKWGAKELKVPSILRSLIERNRDRLVRLSDLGSVKLGITTGANEFFYLSRSQIRGLGIEEEFLRPVFTSPRDIPNAKRSINITPDQLEKRAFVCHARKEDIKGTAAEKYIRWGEDAGYDKRPFCASRPVWYDLGTRERMPLAMNELMDTTAFIFRANGEILFDKNFIVIQNGSVDALKLCAAMNCTFFQLAILSSARENLGGGAVRIATHELSNLLLVHPKFIEDFDSNLFSSTDWGVSQPSVERKKLDELIFDTLDIKPRVRQIHSMKRWTACSSTGGAGREAWQE